MKKNYETPAVEVVEFNYSDQVVATSGCDIIYINQKSGDVCTKPEPFREHL